MDMLNLEFTAGKDLKISIITILDTSGKQHLSAFLYDKNNMIHTLEHVRSITEAILLLTEYMLHNLNPAEYGEITVRNTV